MLNLIQHLVIPNLGSHSYPVMPDLIRHLLSSVIPGLTHNLSSVIPDQIRHLLSSCTAASQYAARLLRHTCGGLCGMALLGVPLPTVCGV